MESEIFLYGVIFVLLIVFAFSLGFAASWFLLAEPLRSQLKNKQDPLGEIREKVSQESDPKVRKAASSLIVAVEEAFHQQLASSIIVDAKTKVAVARKLLSGDTTMRSLKLSGLSLKQQEKAEQLTRNITYALLVRQNCYTPEAVRKFLDEAKG